MCAVYCLHSPRAWATIFARGIRKKKGYRVVQKISDDCTVRSSLVRCPDPHHRETDSLEGLRQVQDQGQSLLIFFLCFPIHSFHPIRISHTVCWAPPCLPSVASSGALTTSHQRINVGMSAIGLSLVTFFGIKKKYRRACLLRPFSTLLHLFQELHCVSSCFLCHIQEDFFGRRPSEPTPVFALYNLDTFPIRPLLALAGLPPISSTPHFSKASSMFCTLSSHCQCLAHSFLFASQRSNGRAIRFFYLQDLCTSPPCCRLTDLVQEPSASLSFAPLFDDAFPPSFPPRPSSLSPPATYTISAWCLPILDGSTLSHSLPPTIQ